MLTHAGELGANAVIGVRYDATEIAPGITEVLCYGTAVFVEERRAEPADEGIERRQFSGAAAGQAGGGGCRRPRWFFWPQVALFVACVRLHRRVSASSDMNRDDLVGPNQKYHQNFLAFQKEFPQQDDLVVVVESDDMEKNRQFVERHRARKWQAETNLFRDVFYQQNLAMMGNKALLFVPENDLAEMQATRCRTICRSSSSSRRRPIWSRFLSRSTRRSAPRRARTMRRTNRSSNRCRHWRAS